MPDSPPPNHLSRVASQSLDLAARLRERWSAAPGAAEFAAARAGESLEERGVRHSKALTARVVLGAVVVDSAAESTLSELALQLHDLVERAVDWTLADPARLARYFPEHVRMSPWLRPTPGLPLWQGYSRYDAILDEHGRLRFIELNTGCPGSFHNAPRYHAALGRALLDILGTGTLGATSPGIPDGLLPELLLACEARAGDRRELLAILNDENGLQFELPLMLEALRARGRDAVIASAADLTYAAGCLQLHGRPVSATFNKFRLSTPRSPHHCWKPGFETRYGAFLSAISDGALASINNLVALSVAEDKGMLALLHTPEFRATLAPRDRAFIDEHVAWTARLLADGRLDAASPPDLVRDRADLVTKPANEGRGYRVAIGHSSSPGEWAMAITPDPAVPTVVQRYHAPLRLPVLVAQGGTLQPADYYTTLSLAVVDGRYRGSHFRASPGHAVNEALEGATITVVRRD